MFRGSIVALVTPFVDDVVDIEKIYDLVEFHIESGTHAIVAAGTTGESGVLNVEEKCLVMRTVIDAVQERIPVIAATSANATKDCIHLTRNAMEYGAHAALIMTPAYIKPTQEGLYQHYKAIAEAVAIPIIVYNVPSRTAVDLLPETLGRLSEISNIIGVKDATGDIKRLQDILRLTEGNFDVFSGDDATAAHWMLSGAKGVISIMANAAPKAMAQLCDAALDGDTSACLAIHENLSGVMDMLCVEANPIPIKWIMSRMHLLENNGLRMPLLPLSTIYHEKLEHALKQAGLV